MLGRFRRLDFVELISFPGGIPFAGIWPQGLSWPFLLPLGLSKFFCSVKIVHMGCSGFVLGGGMNCSVNMRFCLWVSCIGWLRGFQLGLSGSGCPGS